MSSLVASSSTARYSLASIRRGAASTVQLQARSFRTHREPTYKSLQDEIDFDDMPEFDGQDTTAVGHLLLRQQRETLSLLRTIKTEMPGLVAFRKPFVPPTPKQVLVHRQLWYGGEEHPAMKKAVIVVPVSLLPLTQPWSIHKFKLIAGPRWSIDCPKDGGFSGHEVTSEETSRHGFVKISCEELPEQGLNLKWCSDALDRMIQEANDAKDKFVDIPVDTRHLAAKDRKDRLGKHMVRRKERPTIRDFPKEWLQQPKHDALPHA